MDRQPLNRQALENTLFTPPGGPLLYQQRYGPPMMRARHLPFPIDEDARQVWLSCFFRVLDDAPQKYNFPAEHLPGFRAFLDGFSGWMVNTAPRD